MGGQEVDYKVTVFIHLCMYCRCHLGVLYDSSNLIVVCCRALTCAFSQYAKGIDSLLQEYGFLIGKSAVPPVESFQHNTIRIATCQIYKGSTFQVQIFLVLFLTMQPYLLSSLYCYYNSHIFYNRKETRVSFQRFHYSCRCPVTLALLHTKTLFVVPMLPLGRDW